MRIAVVGTGISGLVCARALHPRHEVVLFEANDRVGGHTHTVDARHDGERHAIDTGFIVFNDGNYPNFIRLLDELDVASRPTSMSFSVRCERTGIEYSGSNLNTLFAQRRNLLRPSFLGMIRDIVRFNRTAPGHLEDLDESTTLSEYLATHRYGRAFADRYLLPMGGAIWSCPPSAFAEFPVRFVIEFYEHHGLFKMRDRPKWRTIVGGSRTYVEKLIAPFEDRIRLGCPVERITRTPEDVVVAHRDGEERFDEVVLACHADQSLRMLADADAVETELLGSFPYGMNDAVLHTDASVLPRRRRAWASWNYRIAGAADERPTVTYLMNELQHIDSPHAYCVSLNETDAIDPAKVLGRYRYAHPVFNVNRDAAQRRHGEVIRHRRTSFCGAYWGSGFHEDGVNSALAVCRAYDVSPFLDASSVDVDASPAPDAALVGAGRAE